MQRFLAVLGLSLGLAACEADPPRPVTPAPPMPLDRVEPQGISAFRNGELSELLLRLAFEFEDGARRERADRLPTPISVVPGPDLNTRDLPAIEATVGWISRQSGLDIRFDERVSPEPPTTAPGSVLVVAGVDPAWLRQSAPTVGCFVLPGPPIDVKTTRQRLDFHDLIEIWQDRRIMTVYLPRDITPGRRDTCLFEEITQSLGLFNDIFDLLPSIFNDDGLHVVPTRLDILMLQAFYALSEEAVRDRDSAFDEAMAVFSTLNPDGDNTDAPTLGLAPRPVEARVRAAYEASAERNDGRVEVETIGDLIGDVSPRHHAMQCMLRGQWATLQRRAGEDAAIDALDLAAQSCRLAGTDDRLRLANLDAQRGLYWALRNRPERALPLIDRAATVADAHGLVGDAAALRTIAERLREIAGNGT